MCPVSKTHSWISDALAVPWNDIEMDAVAILHRIFTKVPPNDTSGPELDQNALALI